MSTFKDRVATILKESTTCELELSEGYTARFSGVEIAATRDVRIYLTDNYHVLLHGVVLGTLEEVHEPAEQLPLLERELYVPAARALGIELMIDDSREGN